MTRLAENTDGRAVLFRKVTEKQWQAQVEAWARRAGWRTYHTFSSYGSAGGFPDLVMVRGERLIFAELKTEKGKLSEKQQAWLDDLCRLPYASIRVWRPSDQLAVKAALA